MSQPGPNDVGSRGTAPIDDVIERVRRVYRTWVRGTTVAQMREDWDTLFESSRVACSVEPLSIGDVKAQWVSAAEARCDRAVLYLHGGGFQVGSARTHRGLMAEISRAAGVKVLGIDYRLAPEFRYPAALNDALGAYQWLIGQGFGPRQIAIAGDSAGGGLALSTLISLRDQRVELPAAGVLMSAWTDLTASGESYVSRAQADPIHQREMILTMARNYLGGGEVRAPDPRDPLVSPLFADMTGLAPLLIQVGDRETVLSDSTELARLAQAAGVSVELQVWDDMIHVFQQFPAELAQAREALQAIGHFLRRHLAC